MAQVEQSVEVNVPLRAAYDQWTQFEEFPSFMDGVESVVQRGDKYLDWTAEVAGQTKRWTAEIVDQTPDRRIAWRSIDGAENGGAVLFDPVDASTTKVTLRMEADPEGLVETAGEALGFLDRRVKGDLDRFKAYIEDRRVPTGAWRGEIHGEHVADDR